MSLPDLSPDKPFDYLPYKGPFHYDADGTMVLDSEGHMVVDIRGWGYLTGTGGMNLSEEEAAKIQDRIGARVAELLNADAEGRLVVYNRPVPETEEEKARRLKGTVSPLPKHLQEFQRIPLK